MSGHPNILSSVTQPGSLVAEIDHLLRDHRTYPEQPRDVTRIETHISTVYLTDRFAYKLKKPVRFEFLDFSTPDARRIACEEEVRINRRLAPDVYLGVIPIVMDPSGSLRLGGNGQAVDWLVKMRRLPENRMFDTLIQTGNVCESDTSKVAVLLARFYLHAPPLMVRPVEYCRKIERQIRANCDELLSPDHDLPASIVKRVHSAQLGLLLLAPELFENRVCDGRIIDGHGDLRPEHICVEPRPVVFDCIEFSAELRQVDVIDELSFLAMECDALQAGGIGRKLLEAYCRSSGDWPPEQLVNFYKAYRACVRAKVFALRGRQLEGTGRQSAIEQALKYLRLADSIRPHICRPWLIVVGGTAGTGKSTLARSLAEMLGAEVLQTDAIRREMFQPGESQPAFGAGQYQDRQRQDVYEEMFRRAGQLIDQGASIVLDGTFLSASLLHKAAGLASPKAAVLIVRCDCPPQIASERIRARIESGDRQSDARPEFVDLQQRELEQIPSELHPLHLDTTDSLAAQITLVLSRLAPLSCGNRSVTNP